MTKKQPQIFDQLFKAALASEIALLAREIQVRDKCSDQEAIDRAMKEYDKIVLDLQQKQNELRDAQDRKRRDDQLRAQGKPTLKATLGDMIKLKGGR